MTHDVSAPPIRPEKKGTLLRNVMHLGSAQIATIIMGFFLTATLGRSLGSAEFGVLYTVLAISGFASVAIDWGQATYLVREAARGRPDQAELIGSALLMRTLGTGVATILAALIAYAFGYDRTIVSLAPLVVLVGFPASLYQPFNCIFRGNDRMDVDAIVGIVGKAMVLAATLLVVYRGGGLTHVILAQGVGSIASLLVGGTIARRAGIAVKRPKVLLLRELWRGGAPIVVFGLAFSLHSFVDTLMLSRMTNSAVVGWYAAAGTILGIIIAPASILSAASFPALSRASRSVPDLRRTLADTARVLMLVAGFAAAGLFVYADHLVAIVYRQGQFDQASSILRVSAVVLPLLFVGFLYGNAMTAIGKTNEVAAMKVVSIVLGAGLNWYLIELCQRRFGNGAIALAITGGLLELFAVGCFLVFLPRGVVSRSSLYLFSRAAFAALCTAVPLLLLQHNPLWQSVPVFTLVFLVISSALGLILPADINYVVGYSKHWLVRQRTVPAE